MAVIQLDAQIRVPLFQTTAITTPPTHTNPHPHTIARTHLTHTHTSHTQSHTHTHLPHTIARTHTPHTPPSHNCAHARSGRGWGIGFLQSPFPPALFKHDLETTIKICVQKHNFFPPKIRCRYNTHKGRKLHSYWKGLAIF